MARKKQREQYGSDSVFPVMVKRRDKNGNVVLVPKLDKQGNPVLDDKTGEPVMVPDKVQERNKKGEPVWRVCVTVGVEKYVDDRGRICKRQIKAPQKRAAGTLEHARKVKEELAAKYKNIEAGSAKMTFPEACDRWAASMRNANTCSTVKLKDYETMLGHMALRMGDKPLAEIDELDVEGALVSVKTDRNLSQRRHREMFQTVKRVFEYCIDRGWLVKSPCRGLNTPRVTDEVDRRSLTPEECARLRACLDRDELVAYESFAAKEQRQTEWGHAFTRSKITGLSQISGLIAVRLMLATGCRRGEALGLTWEHVDFDSSQITIVQSLNAQMVLKSPKTKKGIRTISVDTDTMAHLRKWKSFQAKALHLVMVEESGGVKRSVGQNGKTPVCCNCGGALYDPTKCSEWWRGYRESIGFDTLRMHELRHTSATLALGSGMPVKDVQARLGHASSSLTLDIYGHAIPANDQAIAELMGAIIGAPAEPSARVVKVGRKTA